MVSTRSTTIAPAASRPAIAGGSAPVARQRRPSPPAPRAPRFAPGPSGTACRRTSARRVDDEHGRIVEVARRAPPSVPCSEQRVAGGQLRLLGAEVLALPLHREHDEIAAVGDHARGRPSRRSRSSAAGSRPRPRRLRASAACLPRAPARTARRACARGPMKSARHQPRRCDAGSRRSPKSDDDRDRADEQRDADERELEVAEPAHAGVVGGLRDDHVHRRPGQHEQRAGVRARTRAAAAAATAERPSRTAITTTTGSSAATAPLTLISAVSSATSSIVQHDQPRAARRRRGRSAPARPTR